MSVSRIYRLLRLITMLQSGQTFTADELASELEVSRRTIFRDLNVLEMAHIPYHFDREQGTYRVERHFFLAPLNLTLNEALSLLVSVRRTRHSPLQPLASASQRAALKLESVLPSSVREYLGEVMDKLELVNQPTSRQENLEESFDHLLGAISQNRSCRITYISFQERKQIRLKIDPLRLTFVGRSWYVLAYSHLHGERRTFKLGRVKKLTVLEESFDPSERSRMGEPFGQAWLMIPEGKLFDVHLRFDPKVAGNVAEVSWHASQQVQWNDDGSMDFKVRVDGLGEIGWWVLGYGDRVKVLSPPELVKRIASVASNVASLYTPVEN
jgi:proteasome accessory factor B